MQTLNAGNTVVEIPDTLLFERIAGQKSNGKRLFEPGAEFLAWIRNYGFCYEIKVPPVLASQKFKIMLDELNRYFGALYGIVGSMEKRNLKYLALVRTSDTNLSVSKGGISGVKQDAYSLNLTNMKLGSLTYYLAIPLQKYPPIIDETGYNNKVDISLQCQLTDLDSVNKELKKYGLELVEKQKLTEIGVIKMKEL